VSKQSECQLRNTAFSSPKLPHLAKWALRLALELPAATPHSARSALERLSTMTLIGFGNAGERQSSIMALSLSISAASLNILHSGSSAVPSLCAKRMVAIRPVDSCRIERSRAAVGEAVASPTPTPGKILGISQIWIYSTSPHDQRREVLAGGYICHTFQNSSRC
jgi:hypothetical protein